MAENSSIEWTTHTFNPWRGCTKVSPGCANCYADTLSKRNPGTLGIWGPHGTRVVAAESYWCEPIKWNAEAAKREALHSRHPEINEPYQRPRVFCASLADVFEDWRSILRDHRGMILHCCEQCGAIFAKGADKPCECHCRNHGICTLSDVRARLFKLIDATPSLDWLLLTKRPENIERMMQHEGCDCLGEDSPCEKCDALGPATYRPNLWLGTSVESQQAADQRIPHLLKTPAAVRFLSCEPLLGPVQLDRLNDGKNGWLDCLGGVWGHGLSTDGQGDGDEGIPDGTTGDGIIDWVIVGGESGHGARPMDVAWVRSIIAQCKPAGVACFVKQLGAKPYDLAASTYASDSIINHGTQEAAHFQTLGKTVRDRKGGDMAEWPSDLKVREFPDGRTLS